MSENVYFLLDDEVEELEQPFDLNEILQQIEDSELINDDLSVYKTITYNETYTVKELLHICDYYGLAKELKACKFNKQQIIHFLVEFESCPDNLNIVSKRQNMWFYISELKNDKFMKKYVLW
jgi:DNA integrity scanning protein DisA with diadenylate cyclase activity